MKSFVRNLSAPAEFCLVVLIAFGLPLIGSSLVVARRLLHADPRPVRFDDHSLILLLLTETLILATIYWLGHIRGWASETFHFQVSWRWTVVGVLLFGLVTAVAALMHHFVPAFGVAVATRVPVQTGGDLTLPFVILNSVTNPVFEELLEAGYVISSLHKFGMWPAILAGALLRSSLHVYLGVNGALVVLATGVIFGLVYWRWRQLWPLIFAHALLDFLGLQHVDIFRLLHLTNHLA